MFSISYVLRKKEDMALADTEKKTVNEIRDAPDVLVLHSLTNELKESAPTCVSPMNNIITNIQSQCLTLK